MTEQTEAQVLFRAFRVSSSLRERMDRAIASHPVLSQVPRPRQVFARMAFEALCEKIEGEVSNVGSE